MAALAGCLSKEGEEGEPERSIEMPRSMRTMFLNWGGHDPLLGYKDVWIGSHRQVQFPLFFSFLKLKSKGNKMKSVRDNREKVKK